MKGLAVDIDCTLSNTNVYWIKILKAKFGNVGNLTTYEIIQKYTYASKVPQWQTDEAKKYMTHLREDSDAQFNLPLIKGADKWVRRINKLIPIKAYLTMRPKLVHNGTKRWLEKYGFPKAKIISRPNKITHEGGNKWKADKLMSLYPDISGIIDDNPFFIDALGRNYKGIIFLYKNDYQVKNNIKIIKCLGWSDVYSKVNQYILSNSKKNH